MKYIYFIILVLLASCFGQTPKETGKEGKLLPDFVIQLTDSTSWLHTKDIPSGKPSALFLFRPDCPHCKSQMSKIISDIDKLKDINFYVITGASLSGVRQFEKNFGLKNYNNIKVGRDTADFLAAYLGVKGVPFTALYNKEKKLQRAFSGVLSTHLIKAITLE